MSASLLNLVNLRIAKISTLKTEQNLKGQKYYPSIIVTLRYPVFAIVYILLLPVSVLPPVFSTVYSKQKETINNSLPIQRTFLDTKQNKPHINFTLPILLTCLLCHNYSCLFLTSASLSLSSLSCSANSWSKLPLITCSRSTSVTTWVLSRNSLCVRVCVGVCVCGRVWRDTQPYRSFLSCY